MKNIKELHSHFNESNYIEIGRANWPHENYIGRSDQIPYWILECEWSGELCQGVRMNSNSLVMSSNWLTNWLCNDHWSLLRQLWLISNKDTDKRDNKSIENTSQWMISPSNLCRREKIAGGGCCCGLAWRRRIFCYIVVHWLLLCVSKK